MRVAIYARVSKADRDDPNSIPVQLADCRERAAEESLDVIGEYVDEGISAWSKGRKRPEYLRLLADLEAGRFDVVLVREQERLLRQMKDALDLQDLAEAGKLKRIACTMEGDVVFTRARDRDEFRKRASQAQFYSDFLGEKVRATHRRKRENGEWKGGGSRPFGLRILGPKPYRAELDSAEAALLRSAADGVLAGRPLRGIARELNAAGARTATGTLWTGTRLGQVLRRPYVGGLRPDGSPAGTPAIIEPERWRAVRDLLEDPERAKYGVGRVRRHFLVGTAVCAHCGTKLTAHPNYHGRRTYICRRGYDGTGCGKMRIVADPLEEWVGGRLYDRWVRDQAEAAAPSPAAPDTGLRDELRELEGRLAELAEDYYRNRSISRDEYLAAKRGLDEDIARLRSQVAVEVQQAAGTADWGGTWNAPETWPEVIADPSEVEWHAELARRYLDRVVVNPAPRPGPSVPPPERVELVWRTASA